jgi:hypothetical protein
VTLALLTAGLRKKKFAGSPALAALVRREAVPSRSVAALVGFGFGATSRPASVLLLKVDVPPVYAAGLPASRLPVRYAR